MNLAIFFLFIGLASSTSVEKQGPTRTIVDTLLEMGQTTILDMLQFLELTETLQGEGPFTAFFPKEEVFQNLPIEVLQDLLSDWDVLRQVLLYHVVPGKYLSSALQNDLLLPTAQGESLRVNIYNVNDTPVASVNGVPIDLLEVDIEAENGVIHFLDFIMLGIPVGDTVETLNVIEEVSFEALTYAAESLDLVGVVQEAVDITFLAPIDSEGFTVEIVDALLEDPAALTAILGDHLITTGALYSIGIGERKEFVTSGGNTLFVTYSEENGYAIEDGDGNVLADVIAGDIPTTQGVLHILDRPIIVPAAKTAV